MKHFSLYILIFSIAFAAFFTGPALLNQQFSAYPLVKTGDVLDLFTPLILMPLYWLLFRLDGRKPPGLAVTLVFLLLAAFWVEGQGMHLSANSIGHLLKGTPGGAGILAGFYDEVLSHYLWHFGVVALSALLIIRQWRNPFREEPAAPWPLAVAGVIYGLTFFIIVIEGATTPLGMPFAALVVLFGLVWGRRKMKQQPLLLFLFTAHLVAAVLFTGWGLYWRGFPEFSKVGIID